MRRVAIPNETMTTKIFFPMIPDVTALTCPARICKSGSAMEMIKPSNNPARTTIQILLDLAMEEPMVFPIGVIPTSTPPRKIVSPIMIKTAPRRKRKNTCVGIGVKVKFKIVTMTVIGKTE